MKISEYDIITDLTGSYIPIISPGGQGFENKRIDSSIVGTLSNGTYSTTLNFNTDQDIYKDATGLSITFTLGTNNVNGKGIILRLNKPTAVTFPGTFEADANSQALDATKMNVYFLVFFTNWNGSGLDHVIYKNSLFTAQ